MTGNRPSTFITWDKTNAESLGKLVSLYENATIVCGLLWGINSFDQWGVELGKEISRNIYTGQNLEDLSKKKVLVISSSLKKGLSSLLSEVWKRI